MGDGQILFGMVAVPTQQSLRKMEDHHHQLLLQSHSFMPLLPRVDRLDSVVRYIERKNKLLRWKNHRTSLGGRKDKKCMPLNVAAQEANSKGSLILDRILSIEDRLVQLSQHIQSISRTSSTSSSMQSKSLWTKSSSCGAAKSELPLSSYPTFTYPINNPESKPQFEVHTSRHEFQGIKKPQEQHPSDHMHEQQEEQGEHADKEKTCKSGKKKRPFSWPRLKILGC